MATISTSPASGGTFRHLLEKAKQGHIFSAMILAVRHSSCRPQGCNPAEKVYKLAPYNVAKKEVKELYEKCRCAIAHANYDPSALDEVGSVAAKIQAIKGLANESIRRLLTD